MSQPNNRLRDPNSSKAPFVAVILGIIVLLGMWLSIYFGHALEGSESALPTDPFAVIMGVFTGRVQWPASGSWIALAYLLLIVALIITWLVVVGGGKKHRTRVDSAAKYLGTGQDIESLTEKSARATAERLGVTSAVGVPIGKHVLTGKNLYGSWEDMHIDIWGPRTGKTTSRAIPAILDAPGAVLVTSNKRDVVDATRGPRATKGPVWVFDPQGISLEQATWWWNPLSYVTDEVRAARLAEHFASGSREPGAKTDSYFDPAGQDLLAGLLLAAALDKRPLTDVYIWLTRPSDETPAEILEEHGYTLSAAQLNGVIALPEKQRGGIYGTAQQMAACLTNREVIKWVTPQGENDQRPQFNPERFVAQGGTLFSLSKEGKGTAGPLVTALTVAVVEAAETKATYSPGGRLQVPLVAVLDEAANVCRWRTLPDLYSHYGSRGIVIITILQSWSQGVEVWGDSGMKKLWSASNIKVYGGGVAEDNFLQELSRLVGSYDRLRTSTSNSRGGSSISRQVQRENVLEVEELAAMPKGRALVLSSGNRATLIRTQPWMSGRHAEAIRASILANDPTGRRTLEEAQTELAAVQESEAKQ